MQVRHQGDAGNRRQGLPHRPWIQVERRALNQSMILDPVDVTHAAVVLADLDEAVQLGPNRAEPF